MTNRQTCLPVPTSPYWKMLSHIYILHCILKKVSEIASIVRVSRGGSPFQVPASQTAVKAQAPCAHERGRKGCRLRRCSKCQNLCLVNHLMCMVTMKLLRGYKFSRIYILHRYLHAWIFVMI